MMRNIAFTAFAIGLASSSFAAGVEPETVRVPVRFETLENAVADGGLIRLRNEYRQDKSKPIVFEAEESTVIELQSLDQRIMKDEQASAAHCLQNVKKFEADFTVETPGQYQVRLRAWFPTKAFYNHNACMDDGEVRQEVDSQSSDPEVWFWTQGTVYDLAKGPHRYVFPSPNAFCGGARIDKVAILPIGNTEVVGLGPEVSPVTTPLDAKAITKRINLRLIKSWQLTYEITENGGTVAVEYSFDQAKWKPMPSGKSVSVPVPKPRFVYFRFRLTGKSPGHSPWVQGVALTIVKESPVGK